MLFPFFVRTRRRTLISLALLATLFGVAIFSARSLRTVTAQQPTGASQEGVPNIPPGSAYRQTNLLSDIPGFALVLDPLLVNLWGVTATASSPFWVANNGTGNAQLIRGDVSGAPVVLNASPQTVTIPGLLPTGAVSNSTSDFQIAPPGGGTPAKANFIFDSETGNLTAWNAASGTTAQNVRSKPGHTYTGLAIGANSGGNRDGCG